MNFISLPFLILLIITFVLYYSSQTTSFQKILIIFSSFIFYGYNNWPLTLLLFYSVFFNAALSFKISKSDSNKKKWAVLSVVLNILTLVIFKYFNMLTDILNLKDRFELIPLPIGISFFTFQGISLAIDVFEDKMLIQNDNFLHHLIDTAVFKSFFPQLVSGPIVKAQNFYPQMKLKLFKEVKFKKVLHSLIVGLFLKCFIANNIKDHTYWIQMPFFQIFSTFDLLFMVYGYSIQIFADFAGYSLIAIGLGELFGYNLGINFNSPYIATSFRDFWNRWHISLTSFLREYLYIPLGGNKRSPYRNYINLIMVLLIGGLWHGARVSFLVWGLYHAMLLVTERFFPNKLKQNKLYYLKIMMTFTFVSFGWVLFKLQNFSEVLLFIHSLAHNWHNAKMISGEFFILFYSAPIVFYHLINLDPMKNLKSSIIKYAWLIYAFMLYLTLFASGTNETFIYFQF